MLYIYGPLLPVRILEEIRFWKNQEREHTAVIQSIAADLEPAYVKLLNDWAVIFDETAEGAQRLLKYATRLSVPNPNPSLLAETRQLLNTSFRQSREFIRQLHSLKEYSAAVRTTSLTVTVLLQIIRESDYFLRALETLSHPGVLEKYMGLKEEPTPQRPYNDEPRVRKEPSESGGTISAHLQPYKAASRHPVPIGGHTLPPLPYPYHALEPYIDEETMRIHHAKHHQSYVDGLNKAEKKLADARKTGEYDLIKHWERELAFHGAGHYLHTVFWSIMDPKGGVQPEGELNKQLRKDFGSIDKFKRHFSEAAEKVEGGGWAILAWNPRSQHLEILQAEKHQNLTQWESIPLLVLDVWEHAYYLKHQNNRTQYIKDWWNVVYWTGVNERYQHALKLHWQPY